MPRRRPMTSVLFIAAAVSVFAAPTVIEVRRIQEEARAAVQSLRTSWLHVDRDNDGKIDHSILMDERGTKLYEELDFNHDGVFDDFLFYENGVMIREEIDTNYDGRIDLWVYMHRGVFVERYEKDRDFDGRPDLVKSFGK